MPANCHESLSNDHGWPSFLVLFSLKLTGYIQLQVPVYPQILWRYTYIPLNPFVRQICACIYWHQSFGLIALDVDDISMCGNILLNPIARIHSAQSFKSGEKVSSHIFVNFSKWFHLFNLFRPRSMSQCWAAFTQQKGDKLCIKMKWWKFKNQTALLQTVWISENLIHTSVRDYLSNVSR